MTRRSLTRVGQDAIPARRANSAELTIHTGPAYASRLNQVMCPAVRAEGKYTCISLGLANVQRPRASCHVYVDFDGTIVPGDATDTLFDRFAPPQWRLIEGQWQSGQIGSRDCLTRQVALLKASRAELLAALQDIEIDPAFAQFAAMCHTSGVGLTIVSDGFDLVIDAVLRRNGLDIGYFANHLTEVGNGHWCVTFPHSRADCMARSGHCKCSRTHARTPHSKVVIGDGRSDHCIATRADLVFAKASLLRLCRDDGTPHVPFENFEDLTPRFSDWLAGRPLAVIDPLAVANDARSAGPGGRNLGSGGQAMTVG